MAVTLRQRFGAQTVLDDLRRLGLAQLSLTADAPDDRWGRVLSLGEEDVTATAGDVSSFLVAIGRDGDRLMQPATARRLRAAMEQVVQRGTAASISDAFSATNWSIGGKTGTGPGQCGSACDGWFAGLLSEKGSARYTVLAFVRARGRGGVVAAQTAAKLAKHLTAATAN
jgi:membrane peptidoglycan carboxypeptidase